jgi:hypothetical protein
MSGTMYNQQIISSLNESFKELKEKYNEKSPMIINAPMHDQDDLNGL